MAFRFQKRIARKSFWFWTILGLIIIGIIIYLGQTGKLKKPEWRAEVGEVGKSQEEAGPEKEVSKEAKAEEGEKEEVPPIKEVEEKYELIAQKGEGFTHLARRALKEYLMSQKPDFELTPEHKIYIEDYIQNRLGDRWLNLSENVTISKNLIKEAIESSRQLTPSQLENLTQYAALVPSLNY